MKLIGIAGTNGAGKDTVGALLSSPYNFLFVSVSDLLREECRTRGLEVNRENLRMVSAEWRREGGLGVLVDKAIAHYEKQSGYDGLAIASLRNPGEADRVHELGGQVFWVDADSRMRYERIQSAQRGRGAEDDKTYEQFLAEEQAEMQPSGDAATLNMSAVKEKADTTILNEGSEVELQAQLTTILS